MCVHAMKVFIVTVKLGKNPEHNPHDKKTAACPASQGPSICTDSTGEHHSFLCIDSSASEVAQRFKERGFHVARVEDGVWHP